MSNVFCFGCGCSLDESDHFRHLTQTCKSCLDSLVFARGISLSVYLQSRPHPAALLAHDHTVLFANSPFRALKVDEDVVGLRVGVAIECMYAQTLGRCGETEVCILCSLRRAVEHTWHTGEGLRGVSMSYPSKGAARRKMEITTERVGDAVLVILAEPAQLF